MRQAGAGTTGNAAAAGQSGEASRGPADETRVARSENDRGGATRVLVVDDESAVRRFVAEALRGAGYEVLLAANGREALGIVYGENISPALLITDIEMPGMTGVELAARVRADRPAIRVVLMTGRETSAARARERAGLVEGVLLKPFGLAELLDAVIGTIGEPARD